MLIRLVAIQRGANPAALGKTSTERLRKSQGLDRLAKRRTRMTICTYNARTLASDASVEDLMMQARKIKYDVIGLTETRRHRPLHAVFDTGEELYLGTCDSRGVGGVGVFVNTNLAMNIDSFEQLTTRIGRLRLMRRGSMPVFVVYAPTSDYDDEEVEAFYMELEKLNGEGRTFSKVIIEISTRRSGLEGRRKSFISASMVWNGTNRVKGCLSSSYRRTPSMVTRSSRNPPPGDGLRSLRVDCTTTKSITLLSTEGFT
ncbi:unnamed protein product [Nippostrongylus brasiliensis]|uniref:Endo/exonuclease/phosphatase domain-containing protein n=1 Tax=Nippostrongylus brasiliensis TaxID=27835 RepID=A0A0N4YNG2_NIPBR|nr:unnamed protein product [Nippostrongylus brasiliensis]